MDGIADADCCFRTALDFQAEIVNALFLRPLAMNVLDAVDAPFPVRMAKGSRGVLALRRLQAFCTLPGRFEAVRRHGRTIVIGDAQGRGDVQVRFWASIGDLREDRFRQDFMVDYRRFAGTAVVSRGNLGNVVRREGSVGPRRLCSCGARNDRGCQQDQNKRGA
jgi:hypothetical protein